MTDRPGAGCGQTVFDLAHLFGDVDMDGPAFGQRQDFRNVRHARGAQGVRSDAGDGMGQPVCMAPARLDEGGIAVNVMGKAALVLAGAAGAETGPAVEDRKQGEGDAGPRRRRTDAPGHFGAVGIGRTVRAMMKIVELADRGEAALQHFQLHQTCDGFDMIGRQPGIEGVHQLPPGPEAVGAGAAPFGQPGHGALEAVRVQIGHARHGRAQPDRARFSRASARDRHDHAVRIHCDTDMTGPSVGQQHVFGMKLSHSAGPGWTDSSAGNYCIYN